MRSCRCRGSCTVKLPVMPRCMSRTCPPDKWASRYFPRRCRRSTLRPRRRAAKFSGQRKPEIRPVLIDARERLALKRRLEAAPHDFDFG